MTKERHHFLFFYSVLRDTKRTDTIKTHTQHTLLQTYTYILRLLQPLLSSISFSPEVAVPVLSVDAL